MERAGATGNRRWWLGITYIVFVALIWTGGTVALQWVQTSANFRRPFVITSFTMMLFTVYLPMVVCEQHFFRKKYRAAASDRPAVGRSNAASPSAKADI